MVYGGFFFFGKKKRVQSVCEAQGLTSGFAWSCWLCGQALTGKGQHVLTMHLQQLQSAGQLRALSSSSLARFNATCLGLALAFPVSQGDWPLLLVRTR